jgi:hypothetical protein
MAMRMANFFKSLTFWETEPMKKVCHGALRPPQVDHTMPEIANIDRASELGFPAGFIADQMLAYAEQHFAGDKVEEHCITVIAFLNGLPWESFAEMVENPWKEIFGAAIQGIELPQEIAGASGVTAQPGLPNLARSCELGFNAGFIEQHMHAHAENYFPESEVEARCAVVIDYLNKLSFADFEETIDLPWSAIFAKAHALTESPAVRRSVVSAA